MDEPDRPEADEVTSEQGAGPAAQRDDLVWLLKAPVSREGDRRAVLLQSLLTLTAQQWPVLDLEYRYGTWTIWAGSRSSADDPGWQPVDGEPARRDAGGRRLMAEDADLVQALRACWLRPLHSPAGGGPDAWF